MVVNNWHRFPIHPSAFCIPPIVDGFIYAEITFLGDFSRHPWLFKSPSYANTCSISAFFLGAAALHCHSFGSSIH